MASPSFGSAFNAHKHFVRKELWLPLCRRQLAHVQSLPQKKRGPLRYLTFCGEDAVDVLMLEKHNVLAPSAGQYPLVTFAAKTDQLVRETLEIIPGASGFPGDFFETVLFDASAPAARALPTTQAEDDEEFFAALKTADDSKVGRARLNLSDLRSQLSARFPFDVINLDLCDYTFTRKEDIPGRKLRALQQILEWQGLDGSGAGDPKRPVRAFALLYTTRIDEGYELEPKYEKLLDGVIDANIASFPELRDTLVDQRKADSGAKLRKSNLVEYLRLGTAKHLVRTITECGWEISVDQGVPLWEIERKNKSGRPYGMLHIALHLRRTTPSSREQISKSIKLAGSAYHKNVKTLFESAVRIVPKTLSKDVHTEVAGLRSTVLQRRSK